MLGKANCRLYTRRLNLSRQLGIFIYMVSRSRKRYVRLCYWHCWQCGDGKLREYYGTSQDKLMAIVPRRRVCHCWAGKPKEEREHMLFTDAWVMRDWTPDDSSGSVFL